LGDKINKKKHMGGACRKHGRREDVHAWFWWGNLRERDRLENLGVEKILKKHVGCGLD
jgi:hypothetical protein